MSITKELEELCEYVEEREKYTGGLDARKGIILGKLYLGEDSLPIRCHKGEFQIWNTFDMKWSELEDFNLDELYIEIEPVK